MTYWDGKSYQENNYDLLRQKMLDPESNYDPWQTVTFWDRKSKNNYDLWETMTFWDRKCDQQK